MATPCSARRAAAARAPRADGPRIAQAFARALLAELAAAASAGAAPAEHPASRFPDLSAPWLPTELVFGARRPRALPLPYRAHPGTLRNRGFPPQRVWLAVAARRQHARPRARHAGCATPLAFARAAADSPGRRADRVAPALGRTPFERALHPRVVAVLAERLTWGFDVIELGAACAAAGEGAPGPLATLAYVLFEDAGLCAEFGISEQVLLAYFSAIQAGYLAQPYHNALHACDVLAAMNYVLTAGGIDRCLSRVELMAALVAAAVHDFAHPGVNNAFLVAVSAPLAKRYNDTHVLENYHLCSTFAIMARPGCNLVAGMAPADARALRRQVVALVLATDMSTHSAFMAEAARRLGAPGGLTLASNEADRDLALRLCLKCADISNAAKPVGYAVRWGVAILTELFRQGDLERTRGMAINPLCDRSLVSVSSAQQGFLDGIARPLFAQLGALAPAVGQGAVARIMRNSAFYAAAGKAAKPAATTGTKA